MQKIIQHTKFQIHKNLIPKPYQYVEGFVKSYILFLVFQKINVIFIKNIYSKINIAFIFQCDFNFYLLIVFFNYYF